MRIAVWTPIPPQRSGIADYAYDLLAELADRADVVAVVRDDFALRSDAPPGVTVIAASDYDMHDVDIDVYHVGNNAHVHGYIHAQALSRPGMLVLHDPALVDLYKRIGGGVDGHVFRQEVAFNRADLGDRLPLVAVDDDEVVDAIELLMSRRLVEASLLTVVHSSWAADELSRRSPGALVVHVPEGTSISNDRTEGEARADAVFGVFGGLSRPKRVSAAVRAFAEVHRERPATRLLIAGRVDDPIVDAEINAEIEDRSISDAVSVQHEIADDDEFQRLIAGCDAVIALRWPTVGETSALVMRALGAGRIVIVSDVPQYRELDARYCWRIPTDPRLEHDSLTAALRGVATDPRGARTAGLLAREYVASDAAMRVVAGRHLELLTSFLSRGSVTARDAVATSRRRDVSAVNAIASWEATTGLTEAARRCVGALVATGVRVAMDDFDYGAPRMAHRYPENLRTLPRGRPYGIDLCFLNVNELHVVPEKYLRQAGHRRRLIAYWYWELATLSRDLRTQVARVDEIWVASEFVAQVFRSCTAKPVEVVPCVVEPAAPTTLSRADFGLPEASCVFFFNFDANSTVARKNPRAVIEAYRRAFDAKERSGGVHLVMKTMNLSRLPEAQLMLCEAMSSVGGTILDEDMTAQEVAALTAASDVYVSLHRAEGFGLGMAEAMYLGKPVVATAYSGNTDFMTMSNSCPIGYRITRVDAGELRFNPTAEHVYAPGGQWAEPDVAEAARRMRFLYEHPHVRDRIGSAAALTIRERSSAIAVGARMEALLRRPWTADANPRATTA